MVTDLDYQKEQLPILDLSLLKVSAPHCASFVAHHDSVHVSTQFKERDMLEGIFKFWRLQDASTFDISKHWYDRV